MMDSKKHIEVLRHLQGLDPKSEAAVLLVFRGEYSAGIQHLRTFIFSDVTESIKAYQRCIDYIDDRITTLV